MNKAVRNSVFTLVVLGLTAVGLSWNKHISYSRSPVGLGKTVLLAENASNLLPLGVNQRSSVRAFPLELTFTRPRLLLGQIQEMTVSSVPYAELEIVTIYPDGSIDNPQTLRASADETGRYRLKFTLDDFAHRGNFETIIRARSNRQQSQASARFALQNWVKTTKSLESNGYVYPLLP